MATPGAIDEDKPLLAQLAHLSPAQYQDWLHRTSRAKARFFASDSLEALTHVKWFVPACASGVFAGVLVGYVAYDCMHYLMHSGRLRGRLRTRHIHHHFDDNVAYGISSPLLDVLLRTNR
ncbi:Dihydroceramide fatty acyl 2-hydroxylase FAH2 [Chlorella vulgaris]